MVCELCDKTALMAVGKKGFCGDYRPEAVAAMRSLGDSQTVTFGDIMRAAMEDKDVGVRQLASMTGLDRRIIQRALKGTQEPRVGVLKLIVEALDRV